MSTSGVTIYQLTASEIINAAYRKTGVMAKGQSADTEELSHGLEALNLVTSQLRTRGMQLWKLNQHTLSLVADQQQYTVTQPNKLNKIYQAWVTPTNSGTKIPVEIVSIFSYNILPSSTSGVPIKMSYIPQNTTGVISIWPKPSSSVVSSYTFSYESIDEIQVVTDVSQTVDLPSEWHLPLVWGIAAELAIELNVPIQDRADIRKNFESAAMLAEQNGQEEASLYVQPRLDW